MTRLLAAGALAWVLACGTAFGQAPQDASTATPAPAAQNSVRLHTVIVGLPAGTPWLSLRPGNLCIDAPISKTWTAGRASVTASTYAPAFKAALEKAGYKVVTPGEDNLFDPESGSADYEAAAVITSLKIDGCITTASIWTQGGAIRGDGAMTIDWQIYSPIKKQVVARASTTGKAHLANSVVGGEQQLLLNSFADNAAALAANVDFSAAMSTPKAFTTGFQMPGVQSKILLSGSLKAGPRKIADAVGSVVTIMNSAGSGSGILISDDGDILTNAHVVGDDKNVRVRWSDGLEGLAQVIGSPRTATSPS
jgi:S1-C subfamily serine protease